MALSTPHLQDMTLVRRESLTDDTCKLFLQPSEPFHYRGGQYVMLGFNDTELKPFSIAAAHHQDDLIELHIRDHEQSAWMQQLFALEPGATLRVKGPNDQYHLDAEAVKAETFSPIILIAGGTGFAPMKAVLDELLALETHPPIVFYWGARTRKDLYDHERMLQLADTHTLLHYTPVLSEEKDSDFYTGLVHQQVLADQPDLSGCRVLVCGPWPMQEAAKADFVAAGLDETLFN
ncbi:MAG: FAD-binding oxidoreductase [Hydrogenovibrio sp.]|uniref:FAD-binding oxidoreductase n=1 Tax=Hydrogenovibrio sp. TaxID=2065821 RepID=UPI002870369B|nr:FAD-binding oxidoreductase [Hydrogenovibrio sp.]MDR9499856.1 FAD-binding oxidoreductase [Hydrogenovibrio sp.]